MFFFIFFFFFFCFVFFFFFFFFFFQAEDGIRDLTVTGVQTCALPILLAYLPDLPIGYDLPTTLLSVGAAVVVTGLGWATALNRRRGAALLGGADRKSVV